ncbi:helix-turn-helix domain-containing protein [Idiomarina piscisalsi]|uniref:helix-turn-helix domain-containing protein n=1 Tax=Idiomarina piscisalsi TaxID=1096243 RepID=UPI00137E4EF8|nr:helix-turn-helix transcriptional regulator [Idiomarina piscisalsi]MTJ02047.1 helix-turn-helix transcriptional regulator [Idiomarina piscisalsi]
MKTLKAISEKLVEERKGRNLSQKDMRLLIGMSQQQYQRVEAGQDIRLSTLLRILAGLELELEFKGANELEVQEPDAKYSKYDFWEKHQKHLED